MLKSNSDTDPLWTVFKELVELHLVNYKEYLERLEATGRSEQAKQLKERYPEFNV